MKGVVTSKGAVGTSGYEQLRLNPSTLALNVMNYEHHEIHGGSHFMIADYALNQAAAAEIDFVMTTPDSGKWSHMTVGFSSSDGATLDVYEGASGVSGGTATTPLNNNRNSSNASVLTVTKDPTAVTPGTKIAGFIAGGSRESGFAVREREIILKQNTTYLFRITSLANSNDIGFEGEWYEHTDKY